MTLKLHIFAAAMAGLLVSSVAGAQMRNGSAPVRQQSVHVRPRRKGSGKFDGQCRDSGSIRTARQRDSNFTEWTDQFGVCSLPKFVRFRQHLRRTWFGI